MAAERNVAGTTLTADDFLNNAEWMARAESIFIALDGNNDGLVTVIDLVPDMRNYAPLNSDPNVIEKFRIALCEFAEELGSKPGISLTKEEYLHNCAHFGRKEVEKVRNGEGSLIHKINAALYDVIDTNHDGNVSIGEYFAFAKVAGGWQVSANISLFPIH